MATWKDLVENEVSNAWTIFLNDDEDVLISSHANAMSLVG